MQALIFDVDGTLADTERQGHRVAFNLAFAEADLAWHWDETLYGDLLQVTGGKERMRFFIERYNPALPVHSDFDGLITRLQDSKTRFYTQLIRQGQIPARSGILRLMQEARAAGLRLAIATTTTPENVDALLASVFPADAKDWFAVIAAGDIVPQKKPAPDIYLYALERLGLAAEQCLALEDSDNGLHAAKSAGLPVLITVNGYTCRQDFSGAQLVVDQLDAPLGVLADPLNIQPAACVDLALLQRLHQVWRRSAAPLRAIEF